MADINKPFALRTDASDRGVGAVLLQDPNQELYPIAYASKKLNDAESRLAQCNENWKSKFSHKHGGIVTKY